MRDLFENVSSEHATEAARRAVRPKLRRRIYSAATAAPSADGFAVQLDDKLARTPAGRLLAAPVLPLAQAIAAEWGAQRESIDPARMPLTRLANAIIDGVHDQPGAVAAEVEKYLASDLVCYRASSPLGLAERQARYWDPLLDWADKALGAHFATGDGVVYVAQQETALAAARAAIPTDPWRLGAAHVVTTLTGSALIALALARGRLTAEEAWQAAHVDEDWNMEQWGRDEMALERRAFRFAELCAAATVLGLLQPAGG
ncbi:MAG: ATPase [Hyphomicrobiales bacterium]|nr:ATPase [Hyphomicrobiales bacterium]